MTMKCDDTGEFIEARHAGALDEHEARQLEAHLAACDDCRAAAAAAAALRVLREQPTAEPPAGLLERVARRSELAGDRRERRSRFWFGAGVGAALAASVMMAFVATGVFELASQPSAAPPAFQVALGEPRNVNIAIEMERDLPDAEITVALTGGIEIDGYAGRRELTWTTSLEAGVNKLTLPIVAVDPKGGRVLVRVGHGDKERRFAMDVEMES